MAAAFELTRPEHGGRFDVTIYQLGWRLGGKGASGRGPSGRIEEHGLHVWLGFYENAFAMMRDCYAEAARSTGVFGDWQDAFLPEPDIGLFAPHGSEGWHRWHGRFSPRPGLPGDVALGIDGQDQDPSSLADYMSAAVGMLITLLLDTEVRRSDSPPPPAPDDPDQIIAAMRALLGRGVFAGGVVLVEALGLLQIAIAGLPRGFESMLVRLVDTIASGMREWLETHLLGDDRRSHVWEMVDLVLACIVGCFRDKLLTDPRGLDAINAHDCRDWLRRHGASERAVNSAFVQGLYDLALAYEDGDATRPGIAAGQGMRGALRMFFAYRGALFWRMRAGMGDVVFAPLYHVLRERGVQFRFFHRLTNVGLAPGGELGPGDRTHVAALDFDVQAKLHAEHYNPLITIAGRPCWPAEPDFSQLIDGEKLAADNADLESHWDRRRADTARLEVGRDFDFVVLGVSVGAIPDVCPEILARDARWRRMTAAVKTVATQAFQVWLDQDLESLGWHGPPWLASAFAKPFDSWCDMAHTIPEEAWAAPPATAVYFCGVLPDGPAPADDDHDYQSRRNAEVKRNAVDFLASQASRMWPGIGKGADGFRWDLLADPEPGAGAATGPARFDSQYWRANVNPTDRYVLSLPGSLEHRISPLDMTYDNMTIAGDWTDCGLNTGCTEAAVMAGRLAAHALSGAPALNRIIGYDHP
ncbi:membrane protein [Polymorphobacter glacialis]|uniref:Membrane protein n=1 Tax=Sandarakinorhabdus glacialis TaxID=1614636 RepID=A0A916ZKT7_9SPHN|nr:membrane protein [Polymorphobacter glacialis]